MTMAKGFRARSRGDFQAGSSTISARVLSGAAASAIGTAQTGNVVATATAPRQTLAPAHGRTVSDPTGGATGRGGP
jgi:hypothetical protein